VQWQRNGIRDGVQQGWGGGVADAKRPGHEVRRRRGKADETALIAVRHLYVSAEVGYVGERHVAEIALDGRT